MQLVIRQQRHAANEILRQHLHVEIRSRVLVGADFIQRALECQPIKLLTAVGQQRVEQLRDALLCDIGHSWAVADVPEHADGIADVLPLHDQREPLASGLITGCTDEGLHGQALHVPRRPSGNGVGCAFAERDILPSAEAAAGRHRLARTLRSQHGR